jgi:hypothetical protein
MIRRMLRQYRHAHAIIVSSATLAAHQCNLQGLPTRCRHCVGNDDCCTEADTDDGGGGDGDEGFEVCAAAADLSSSAAAAPAASLPLDRSAGAS